MKQIIAACAWLAAAGIALAQPSTPAQGWRDKVTAFANENFHHAAWGASHSRRDYALAKQMAAADGVALDDDVLFAAATLHDMAAFPQWGEKGRDHSDVAAEKIDTVLAGTDFPAAKLDAVRAAIRTHMYYRDPVAPEARYLHDADALDWLGAIGVARQFGNAHAGTGAVRQIKSLMDMVPPEVVTPAGKARLPKLLAEDKAFLDALAQESQDFHDL